MAAGEDDLGAARAVLHGHDIGADAVADLVILGRDALAVGHDAFELAEVDHDVGALEPAHGAADDVAGAVLELLEDHLLLRLADALHDRLLGGLGGDAAEVVGGDLHFQKVAELGIGFDPLGAVEGDLIVGVHDSLDHQKIGQSADHHGLGINLDAEIAGGAHGFFRGGNRARCERPQAGSRA